jgi:hypothetical protein
MKNNMRLVSFMFSIILLLAASFFVIETQVKPVSATDGYPTTIKYVSTVYCNSYSHNRTGSGERQP